MKKKWFWTSLVVTFLLCIFSFVSAGNSYYSGYYVQGRPTLHYVIFNNADAYNNTLNNYIKYNAVRNFNSNYNVKFYDESLIIKSPDDFWGQSSANAQQYGQVIDSVASAASPDDRMVVRMNSHAGTAGDNGDTLGYYAGTTSDGGEGIYSLRKDILAETGSVAERNGIHTTFEDGGCYGDICKPPQSLFEKYPHLDGVVSQNTELRDFNIEQKFMNQLAADGKDITQLTNKELNDLAKKYGSETTFQGPPDEKPFAKPESKTDKSDKSDEKTSPNQKPPEKPVAPTDPCPLAAKGMHDSSATGKMYGEHEVKAFNDHRPYKEEIPWAHPGAPYPLDFVGDIESDGGWAVDAAGHDAKMGMQESEINFKWREYGVTHGDGAGVTSDKDLSLIEGDVKQQINDKGEAKYRGKSNQQIAAELAKTDSSKVILPADKDHLDMKKSYVPPNGSSQEMLPGSMYKKKSTATSAKQPPQPDTKVDDQCKFTPLSADEQKLLQQGKDIFKQGGGFPNNVGGNNGGGGGSPGGGQGGGMPQIPQIPQGGGGQPQNSGQPQPGNPSGQPGQPQVMPDGTSCPTEYSPVCGKDGKTYPNLCFAQHSGSTPVEVDHQGACASTPSQQFFDQLNQVISDLVAASVPQSILDKIISAVASTISNIFNVGETEI